MFIKGKKTVLLCVFLILLTGTAFLFSEEIADNYVNIFMGTNNDGAGYSRGNQYPAVTVPFGMNAWAPVTQTASSGWFFDFDDTTINAIKVTHQPSPWAGDHGGIEFFPMTGTLQVTHDTRYSSFQRSNVWAKPYQYRTYLDKYGIWFEVAPTYRAASFNITYPSNNNSYMLIQSWGSYGSTVNAGQNKITGWVENGCCGAGRFYFCAIFNKSFAQSGGTESGGIAYVRFTTGANEVVNMKVGTSYISEAQAEANLNAEIGSKSFEQVRDEAHTLWNNELNKIAVTGGTTEEKTIFYSCFYRGLCFPKARWENVNGTAQYKSPYDSNVHNGKIWVGNGFWDTFRAVWPFFTLMYPTECGQMLDGWVNSYKDGGWTVNWSNPGYWACMIGTHADSLFADAYLKGITNFDYNTAYSASYKNGTVQGSGGQGREGLNSYISRGYVAQDETSYSAARTLEYSYDDFCISQFAKALGKTSDAQLFATRAMNYKNVFSSSVGFFRGKNANGSWRTTDANFHPNEWGYEWIEGCAWQYICTPMQDGQGLATLYGGRSGLEAKIDAMFAASPSFLVGSYGGTIHEMQEAYDIGVKYGLGQYAHGNQPVQHTIYMYNHAGKPSKTQYWVRKVMNDLYESGVSNGYGYCGDEDNGQTSLWYVMSAMGFYSCTPGYPEYTIGSPVFSSITIKLENGKTFTINANNNSSSNVYIQSAALNGANYTRNYLRHADIKAGGTLNFTMGSSASSWGTGVNDLPASLSMSTPTASPTPTPMGMVDITNYGGTITAQYTDSSPAGEEIDKLIDNSSSTKYLTTNSSAWVQFQTNSSYVVTGYSLTSANDAAERDPLTWTFQGSANGSTWNTLDSRSGEDFINRYETKSYSFNNTTSYSYYRLNMTNNSGTILQLAEWEIFGIAGATPTPTRTPTPTQPAQTSTPTPTGLVDITNLTGTVTAQYTDSPSGEDISKLIDNSSSTKYLTFHASGWAQFQANAAYVVTGYSITSANDAAERDPLTWTLQGSNNGTTWTTLDSRSGEDFPNRFQLKSYSFSNTASYTYYRLNMTNNSGTILQLAEWEIFGTSGGNTPTPTNTPANTSTPTNTTANTSTPTSTTANTATPAPTQGTATDITNQAGTVSAQYTDSPSGEDISRLIDNSSSTKYLTFHASGWVQFQAGAACIVTGYSITSANDAAERDPYTWTFQGSNNGSTWTTLDSRTGEDFPNRFQLKSYSFSNTTSYTYYRLNMTNNSGTILQLAEWEIFSTLPQEATPTPTPSPMPTGAIVDVTNQAGTVSAQYTDSPSGEDISRLIDNSSSTKYLTFHASGWVQYQADVSYVVNSYTITSANDAAERDPLTWTLQGSNNGSSWTTLDSRTGEDFPNRFQLKTYTFSNSAAYTYYRLNMTNNSGTILQLAEWEIFGTR